MTTTTLERLELAVEEPVIECEGLESLGVTCSNPAGFVVRYTCGCVHLRCADCVIQTLAWCRVRIEDATHRWFIHCTRKHSDWGVFLTKIEDLVESVQPL